MQPRSCSAWTSAAPRSPRGRDVSRPPTGLDIGAGRPRSLGAGARFGRAIAAAHGAARGRGPGLGARRGRCLHLRHPARGRRRPGTDHPRLGASSRSVASCGAPSRRCRSGWPPTSRPRAGRGRRGRTRRLRPRHLPQPRHRAGGRDRRDRRGESCAAQRRRRRDRLQPAASPPTSGLTRSDDLWRTPSAAGAGRSPRRLRPSAADGRRHCSAAETDPAAAARSDASSSPNCRFHLVNLAIAIDPGPHRRRRRHGALVGPAATRACARARRGACPFPPSSSSPHSRSTRR